MLKMTEKSPNIEKSLVLSEDKINYLLFHYAFDWSSAGVNSVIHNNIEGLKLLYPNIKPIFAAGRFDEFFFKDYEKRKMDLSFSLETLVKDMNRISSEIGEVSRDVDIISAHNMIRGINPAVSGGFRNAAEILASYKKIEGRNHDFVMRSPRDYKKMLMTVDDFGDWFPKNPSVLQTTLTTSTRGDMEIFFPRKIEILRNSVVYDDLSWKNDGKDEKLKQVLLEKGIFEEEMKHVIYAVRADRRKNLEEIVFLTAVLSYVTGYPHKAVVTLPANDEDQKNYAKEVQEFANTSFKMTGKVPISIGEASKYLDEGGFNVGNMYRAGDVAATTAFREGFGYSFVEPWVALANSKSKEKYVLGRIIREVSEDFERNGMVLGDVNKDGSKIGEIFYDSSTLYLKGNSEERMKYLGEILNDNQKLDDFLDRFGLEQRIDNSKNNIIHNANIVKTVYGHDVVAKDLAQLYGLPNWEKIKLTA